MTIASPPNSPPPGPFDFAPAADSAQSLQQLRQLVTASVEHLEHVLPAQAPIIDFVHHNTLHGYQHLSFAAAVAAAADASGACAWMSDARGRQLHDSGRIDDADIDAAIDELLPQPDAVVAHVGDVAVTARLLLRLGLLHDLAPPAAAHWRWLDAAGGAQQRCRSDLTAATRAALLADGDEATTCRELWAACCAIFAIDGPDAPPLQDGDADGAAPANADQAASGPREQQWDQQWQQQWDQQWQQQWQPLRARVGVDLTLGGLLRRIGCGDIFAAWRAGLIRHLGAHLDIGVAAWRNPQRDEGFYAAWRAAAAHDAAWPLAGAATARDRIAAAPAAAVDAIIASLQRLGLQPQQWRDYLACLAQESPGWSGMFLRRQLFADADAAPTQILDYLAVRLLLESLAADVATQRLWRIDATLPALGEYFQQHGAELMVRCACCSDVGAAAGADEDLPEHLLAQAAPLLDSEATQTAATDDEDDDWRRLQAAITTWRNSPVFVSERVMRRQAWPLFNLCQLLACDAAALRRLGGEARALLAGVRRLDVDERGYLWLLAYERHYREQTLAALAANHGRCRVHDKGVTAQLLFCMDDREEGLRRHLEEIAPQLQTFGGAAHFAVFPNYYALDAEQPSAQCPVAPMVVIPAHNVREQARRPATSKAARRRFWRRASQRLQQLTRHALLTGPLLTAAAAPAALLASFWRTFAAAAWGEALAAAGRQGGGETTTQLQFTAAATAPPGTPQAPAEGFSDAEQAQRVGDYLVSIGLDHNFAPLVAIVGHGSNSANNPHLAAYDCGACSGRHSGPNARLFAAMANRPEVRALLAQRGVVIPAQTHFLGAEHNTCDDSITWWDIEDSPPQHAERFAQLRSQLSIAALAHSHERCRRLYSAPLDISPLQAWRHVLGRRHDWSQPRPELGHATNACAIIGRRAMTRGVFFDRRAFLISYDPQHDVDGAVLERSLVANGAVGAGINLEYFFSAADNEGFGCGSKVTHNIVAAVAVMHGAAGDLAPGLPQQMIEVHEAMRLLLVVEQTTAVIDAICARQPLLQQLVGNGWLQLAAMHPHSGEIYLWRAAGWTPWTPTHSPPTVECSANWYPGEREALPPVLLKRPLREWLS